MSSNDSLIRGGMLPGAGGYGLPGVDSFMAEYINSVVDKRVQEIKEKEEAQNSDADTYMTPTYARNSFTENNPVTTIPDNSSDPREVRQMIYDRIDLDLANSSDLGSYNFDYMDPEADDIRQRVIGKVFIDKETYVQTAALGDAVPAMIQEWYHGTPRTEAAEDYQLIGTVTIGSSEAIMLGLIAHTANWWSAWQTNYDNDQDAYKYDRPFLMYARDVHTCWEKYSIYYNVPALVFNLDDNDYYINSDRVQNYLNMTVWELYDSSSSSDTALRFWDTIQDALRIDIKNSDVQTWAKQKYIYDLVCCVGCVIGTTFTGGGDNVEAVNSVVDMVVKNATYIAIHVDAASGGFVVPFSDPDLKWDFQLSNVKSINVSNHKFGATYPGCGTVVFKDQNVVPENMVWEISYLGGSFTDYTVNFSRDSAGPLSAYYNLVRFGIEGYREMSTQCVDNASYLAAALSIVDVNGGTEQGQQAVFELISESNTYPMVIWKMNDNANVGWDLTQLSDILQEKSWKLPAYQLPYTSSKTPDGPYVCRVVTRPDVSREKSDLLLADIKAAIVTLNDLYSNRTKEENVLIGDMKERLKRKGSGDYA